MLTFNKIFYRMPSFLPSCLVIAFCSISSTLFNSTLIYVYGWLCWPSENSNCFAVLSRAFTVLLFETHKKFVSKKALCSSMVKNLFGNNPH